jgi:dolichyl-phosphate-mannose-protein mannosyltransferase
VVPYTARSADAAAAPPASTFDARRFSLVFAGLLLLGVAVRLPFLPRLGHAYDQGEYIAWMGAIQDHGLAGVYEHSNADYVGYQYILWALAHGYGGDASRATVRDKELRVWLKLPGLAGDLLTTALIVVVARALIRVKTATGPAVRVARRMRHLAMRLRLPPQETGALAAGALFLFHPAVIYAGSYWGQQDSLIIFFMLLACWLAWRRRPGWAGVMLALGVLVKPQPLVLGPLLAWLIWRRSSYAGLLRGGIGGALVLALGHAYFLLTGNGGHIWQIYTLQLRQTDHMSYAAYNLWWPLDRLAGARPDTAIVTLGGISLTFGIVATLLVTVMLLVAWRAARRGGATTMLLACGVWLAGFYLVAAGSHERYALPALAFLLVVLPLDPRLRLPLLLYSIALFANLIIALPLDRRWPQGDPVWLTIVVSGVMTVSVGSMVWTTVIAGGAALTPDPSPARREKGRG